MSGCLTTNEVNTAHWVKVMTAYLKMGFLKWELDYLHCFKMIIPTLNVQIKGL